jgi:hypothetical protein
MRTNMRNSRLFFPSAAVVLLYISSLSQAVNFTVFTGSSPAPISPYIYGANPAFTSNENLGARRLGGNRMTGYNWENNASHAGSDWYYWNDGYMEPPHPNEDTPGGTLAAFQNEALGAGAYSAVTLQMAGYVARDKSGTAVTEAETAPSDRWDQVQFVKGSAFSLSPDPGDHIVYMDECVNYLVNAFGMANTANGVKAYILDNEPALWSGTHIRIHPANATCTEVFQKGKDLSLAVKNIDPYAEIIGPALYGFSAFYHFQDASDWSGVSSGKGYDWFIDYYLDEMKKAGTTSGKRLLDVLDIHWYPEAYGNSGGRRIVDTNANNANERAARLQAPRSLWDFNYGYSSSNAAAGENSWIAQYYGIYLPLIPKIRESIDKYYPGTKMAVTEFTYGGERDITGGIATADVLGIFGKYGVYLATFWPGNIKTQYVQAAYRIYRNYDGSESTFGDALLNARNSDSVYTSIYASVNTANEDIHMVVINKNLTATRAANFSIEGDRTVTGGNVWVLDSTSSSIHNAGSIGSVAGNTFSYTLPAGSVCHFVLQTVSTSAGPASPNIPSGFVLYAYPNPFNSFCRIEYRVPDNSEYTMQIADIMGRIIKTYGHLQGNGTIAWEGTNENGEVVASGMYIVILKGGNHRPLTNRIMLIK